MRTPEKKTKEQPDSGNWIPSVCYMCYGCCGIRVHLVDDRVVEIKGDPDNPHNAGKLCAKGKAGVMGLYDPYRLKAPLKRTNPQKGIGIDPVWQEITWDEALDMVVEKLKKISREDPRKLVIGGLDFHQSLMLKCFASAFGTQSYWFGGAGYFCGNGLHPVLYLTNGAFYADPDFEQCNYCILVGSRMGFMLNSNATTMTMRMAEARARGMKVVLVDPINHLPGGRSDEWVPIRPGTDGAFALALANVLVNELGMYDEEFLRRFTNGPYLVGPDGHYVRDGLTRPLVWNERANRPGAYNQISSQDCALAGKYQFCEEYCSTAFQLLKDHLGNYSPEIAEKVTTIPAGTIRRIAREFGQAACIGSTIVIEGRELPLRPAAVNWNRGAIAHRHGMMTGLALQLLNILVGAIDVPGGQLGCNSVGPFWAPSEGPDGMLVAASVVNVNETCYPLREVKPPVSIELRELFPCAPYSSALFEEGVIKAKRFQFPYRRPEILINIHSNAMMSCTNPNLMARVLADIPFIVAITLHLDEMTEFADLVLPDAHYLERLMPFPNSFIEWLPAGPGNWYWMMEQPAVRPKGQVRAWPQILLDIAERLGLAKDLLVMLNTTLGLREPFRLEPDRSYSWEEITDVRAKARFGPKRDLSWFQTHGFFISSKKRVEEAYPRPFLSPRIPIYQEHFLTAGQRVRDVTHALGISWDTSDYQPLPAWKSCPAFNQQGSDWDLYLVNYKLPFHTFSVTAQNPWLDELARHHGWAYRILINEETGHKKGIRDGDRVEISSPTARACGVAKLTHCVHPEVVAIAGTFGHWARGMPIARHKGIHFNTFLTYDEEHIDTVSAALDACVRVKVNKSTMPGGE